MRHCIVRTLIACCALLALSGCSGRQLYDGASGWRENECNRIVDVAERERCLETARLDYERYRRERDAAR